MFPLGRGYTEWETGIVSALPKMESQEFWMESRAAEIPFPQAPLNAGTVTVSGVRDLETTAPPARESILFPDLTPALRFERAISIALIVFGLMSLSMISYHSLSAKFDARETRLSIEQTRGEIGRYREEIQAVKSELGMLTASDTTLTLPIDPSDVAIVTLPVRNRY